MQFDQRSEETRARHNQILDDRAMKYKQELEKWSIEKTSLENARHELELQIDESKKRMAKRHVLTILLWQKKVREKVMDCGVREN